LFLDVGCGVGNSFYPLLEKKDALVVKGFDISKNAVEMAKTHKIYDEKRISLMQLDIVKEEIPDSYKNADYSILMFVLSAIKPNEHLSVIKKIYDAMNDSGILYFRDYARYDMAQLRFSLRKKNKIEENLYMRHDKTLAYYFDKTEIEDLFKSVGFKVVESKVICRMIENRKDNKKMHRLWLQIKFIK
jgi:methyltransferase-like protein 6